MTAQNDELIYVETANGLTNNVVGVASFTRPGANDRDLHRASQLSFGVAMKHDRDHDRAGDNLPTTARPGLLTI